MAGFLLLYGICRIIVWVTGNEELMFLMWIGIATSWLFLIAGAVFGVKAIHWLREPKDAITPRGFEVENVSQRRTDE